MKPVKTRFRDAAICLIEGIASSLFFAIARKIPSNDGSIDVFLSFDH
jgi:hypothetical protein